MRDTDKLERETNIDERERGEIGRRREKEREGEVGRRIEWEGGEREWCKNNRQMECYATH